MTDLEIIKQLEKELGVSLKKTDDLVFYDKAYVINKNKEITHLSLYNSLENKYINLISYIKELKSLIFLNLSWNGLKDVSYLKVMKGLTSLNLEGNKLRDVSFLKELKGLEFLYLDRNRLTDVGFLKEMKNLKYVYIDENPLITPPEEIAVRGIEAIRNYFAELEKSNEAKLKKYINNEVKLILTGNSESGKTTLAEYLKTGKIRKDIHSTHWMEVYTWNPKFTFEKLKTTENPEGKIVVRIFDFGGQEYYHDTHHLFFTNNTAYVLIWNKTTNILGKKPNDVKKAGKEVDVVLQHFPMEYWLEAIIHYTKTKAENEKEFGKDKTEHNKEAFNIKEQKQRADKQNEKVLTPVLVVQNKIDKEEIAFQNQKELKEKYGFIYDFASISLHERKRLDYLKSLIQELFSSMEILGSELPGHWGMIKESIEKYKGKQILTVQEFKEYCNEELGKKVSKEKIKIIKFNDSTIKDFCEYLKRIGRILYYPNIDGLNDNVYIDRNWVLGNIYKILTGLTEKGAEFDNKHIKVKLKNSIADIDFSKLIKLMQYFMIVFSHPHKKDTYIAPLYLPIEPVKGVKIFLDAFKKPTYRFQYEGFIHKCIILHFFQEFGKEALYEKELYYYWRYGIVIKGNGEDEKDLVLVKFFIGEDNGMKNAHIDLYHLNDNMNSKLLIRIIDKLKEINKDWNVKQMVTNNGSDFVPIDLIHSLEEQNMWLFTYENKRFELNSFSEYLKNTYPMKKIFISYSKADIEFLKQLENHLSLLKRQKYISTWNDRKLIPGEEWDGKIKKELEDADIILFLVSSDFLATDYIWDIEITKAIEMHKSGKAKVVPIIVRDCDWEGSPLGILNSPEKALVINKSGDIDEAWKKIVISLKEIIKN